LHPRTFRAFAARAKELADRRVNIQAQVVVCSHGAGLCVRGVSRSSFPAPPSARVGPPILG